MRYEGTVYRPPSEAKSLIIQATIGCSNNSCTFCSMYKDKTFRIRPESEVIAELYFTRGEYRNINRIFLADGDAFALPMKMLINILMKIEELFPECERVSIYATPQSILRRTDAEIKELYDLGLKIAYVGAESGSDIVLSNIKKGVNRSEIIEAIKRIENSGMKSSVTFISGLGGKQYSDEHAEMTGKLISEAEPSFIGLLTLLLNPATPMYEEEKNGSFELLSAEEIAAETLVMLENANVKKECVFRSNHASNYISLKGVLPNDKSRMIAELKEALSQGSFKDDRFRLL